MRLEQSSIRNIRVAFVEAAVSCTYCCGYSTAAAGHGEPRARAKSKVLATACVKAALKAEVGDCHRSHLQMAGFSVQGCCPSMSFSKCKLPSQRCPQKGMFTDFDLLFGT